MVQYVFKTFKTAMNRMKMIDSWFWSRYTLNSYNGCQIGCVYCDARSNRYHLHSDFQNTIMIKEDLGKVLRDQINRQKLIPDIVSISGTSDPYQAAERNYRNTRKVLGILREFNFPVQLVSKSRMLLQDIDLLGDIAANSYCNVSITITTPDEKKAQFLEQGAPTPDQRFDIIATIKDEYPQIQAGILLMPIIPHITDSREDIEEILGKAREVGADYIMAGVGMTMRDTQALWFLKHLNRQYPSLLPSYEKLYHFNYSSDEYSGKYTPNIDYIKSTGEMIDDILKGRIDQRIKRWIPDDYRRANYMVAEHLFMWAERERSEGRRYRDIDHVAHGIQNMRHSVVVDSKEDRLSSIAGTRVAERIIMIIKKLNLQDDYLTLDEWFDL